MILLCAAPAFPQPQSLPTPPPAAAPRRVQVDPDTASALVAQKVPVTYPDAARKAGIQGTVVLRVVTSYSGDVEEVTVISGDPALAQTTADTVKQWKYKPYLAEGSPAEMETEVSINFVFTTSPSVTPVAPPLGTFREEAYSNDYFGVYYPLSRDWVRETTFMRGKMEAEGIAKNTYVLLAEVHIPQDAEPLRADSSFTIIAEKRSSTSSQECKQYLEAVASNMLSRKEGKQKGDLSQFAIAGHDFYRGDFEYRHGVDHGAVLCTAIKEYRLQWNIVGWSKEAIEKAVSTVSSMTAAPPTPVAHPQPTPAPVDLSKAPAQMRPSRVRVSSGVSTGLLIKKVTPDYPSEAKNARIQGAVVLQAVINKTGDVADLEVISGPIELVVSAVNAVRKWKYRPYLLMGEPVEVQTQVLVNYTLQY